MGGTCLSVGSDGRKTTALVSRLLGPSREKSGLSGLELGHRMQSGPCVCKMDRTGGLGHSGRPEAAGQQVWALRPRRPQPGDWDE